MADAAAAIKRLAMEKKKLDSSRVRDFHAAPLSDLFEWHFTLLGPAGTPYAGGLYHGALHFPRNYPFAPPDVVFFTPSGRFEVGKKICSSLSSYHPHDWQPAYDATAVLLALRAFMARDEEGGVGALRRQYVTPAEKRRLAVESRLFRCERCGMGCAEELWEREMAPHPPVAAEVEARAPRMTEGEKINEEGKETVGERGVEGGETSDAEKEDNMINNNIKDNNRHNDSSSKDVARTMVKEREKGEGSDVHLYKEARKTCDDECIGTSQVVLEGNLKGRDEPSSCVGTASSSTSSTPVFIRIRLGSWVLLRVELKQIDTAIGACLSLCSAILLKKYFCS